jgi:hypothetical protein
MPDTEITKEMRSAHSATLGREGVRCAEAHVLA